VRRFQALRRLALNVRWRLTLCFFAISCFALTALAAKPQDADGAPSPAAVEAAARDYRIEIYAAFRTQRDEYNRRRAAGDELLQAWIGAGQPIADAPAIRMWFDEARRRSASGQPLPPKPKLNAGNPFAVPPQPQPPSKPPPSPQPPTSSTLKLPTIPAESARLPGPQFGPLRRSQNPSWSQIARGLLNLRPSDEIESLSPTAGPAHRVAARPKPPLRSQVNANAHAANALSLQRDKPTKIVTSDPQISLPTQTAALPAPQQITQTETIPTPNIAPAPRITPRTPDQPPALPRAQLNTAELGARLQGYQRAWRAVRADLAGEEVWNDDRVETLAEVLTDLDQARNDLLLYRNLAPPEFAAEYESLTPTAEFWKQLAAQLNTAQEQVVKDTLLDAHQRAKELQRLRKLEQKIRKRGE